MGGLADTATEQDPVVVGAVGEHSLMELVASGDQAAFEQLYLLHRARAHGIAVAILHDQAQAQEVTQEVFLQLWQQASRYDPSRGSTATWISRLAHARAVDRVRLCHTARARDTRYSAAHRPVDYDAVLERVLHGDEQLMLRHALQQLQPLQRQSITLAYYAGMSTTEISEQLGVNRSTVKTRIRDGLIKLAAELRTAPSLQRRTRGPSDTGVAGGQPVRPSNDTAPAASVRRRTGAP